MNESGRGGTPRISERVTWDEKAARKESAHWGCWECGFEDSYVRDVDKDTEHIRVRRRQCTRCGELWETEERRISRGSFFGRAETRRYASFRKKRASHRRCVMCDELYFNGRFVEHTQESVAHRRVVKKRAERTARRERKYRRLWTRAKREIEYANRRPGTCKRCGGEYTIGKWQPHARTPQHQAVIQEERRQRRRSTRAAASSDQQSVVDRAPDKAA